jgi:glutaredoxin
MPDTLYSRAGCHLCEAAEAALDAQGWAYERVDISGNLDLERLYGWDVPVLVRGERMLLRGVINRARLLALPTT